MSEFNKLLNKNLNREPDQKAINELIAFISNNPTVGSQDLIRKSMEMGYNPQSLIDQALGSIKIDKSSASLNQSLPDILNDIYGNNPSPGERNIIDPNDLQSKKAKDIYKTMEDRGFVGVSAAGKKGSRSIPLHQTILDAKTEAEKLKAIAHSGHELKHTEDMLIRPGNLEKVGESPYKLKHHAQGIYEPDELIREIKDLPEDPRIVEQIKKHAPDIKTYPWKKLRSLLPIVGPAIGLGAGLMSGDASAAAGEALIPGGVEELQEPNIEEIKNMQKEAYEQQKLNKLQKLIRGNKND